MQGHNKRAITMKVSREEEEQQEGSWVKWQLYVLLLPAPLWLAVFAYYPMYGCSLPSFKRLTKGGMGILGSLGGLLLKHFETIFSTSIR